MNKWARYNRKVYWSSCNVPVIPVRFYWNFNFPNGFLKNSQISNFMQIYPVVAKSFHAGERTDRQA